MKKNINNNINININNNKLMDINTNPNQSNNDEGYLSSTSSNDENYIITTKVCKRLSKEFDLPEIVFGETISYDAPIENGLSNSDIIIPSYYKLHKHPSKILNIDFYEIIKDDIRNCRILNKHQLEYIKEIQDEYKYELIEIFNDCVRMFNDIMK